jgi:ubiquinone/menaquinone biosynthesis C-methylase UbiE
MRYNTFNDTAPAYDSIVTPSRKIQARALIDELNLRGDEHILEIGCGSGLLTLEALGRLTDGGHLTAIDLSENMLAICRRKIEAAGYSNVKLHTGNSLMLPFPQNHFDMIISSNVLPWVGDQDRFVAEAKRALTPGGTFGLIALHPDVYREIFAALNDVRAIYPHFFNGNTVLEDIGVELEDIDRHCARLIAAGFCVIKGYVMSIRESATADEYLRRFNAVTGETHLRSVPFGSKSVIRDALLQSLVGMNSSLTVTEAVNILVAQGRP